MTKRIFRSICLVAIGVLFASIALFVGALYDYFSTVQRNQLKMQTNLAAHGVANEGIGYFDGLDTKNYRITWIDSDGTVLYDSKSNTDEMENHLEREEIKQALSKGFGESSRYSSTLTERSFYSAELLPDGTVLRLSIAQNTLFTLLLGMLQPICIVILLALVLSFWFASRLSKKIVKPLNDINLDEPLNNDCYDELSPLLRRINFQQQKIKRQSAQLRQKQIEFETVTTNMREGIILLNIGGSVLAINRAAERLIGADGSPVGQDILSVNRSLGLQEVLNKSVNGEFAEKTMEMGDGIYQLKSSPVLSEGKVSGVVLLLLNVTEKERSEQMRREFTANVSHELKTPLHTISGCAELMVNGIVKQKDMTKFSSQIYNEAQRMIRLVEDIIKLSHLDEGADDMKREETDIYSMAQATIESLSQEAEASGVKITLNGENAAVYGIPQLLQGIIYNLCDNAIKYNKQGGSVTVTVKKEEQSVILSVADTGIGIPPEHRDRIFERFYRVDKSHSKEIGGTGLGLSIVKHAARLHNADVQLDSVVGKGTVITVTFPIITTMRTE
ncbi:MAG: ATP-binding protein [Ruminococcus sp.]|nr:ATP-binding protein [Ruminococcus sp.]